MAAPAQRHETGIPPINSGLKRPSETKIEVSDGLFISIKCGRFLKPAAVWGHTARTVSRVLSRTVIPLGTSLLVCSSNLPERSASSVIAFCLVLLRMGFSLLRFVTKCTVRSYRTFSPLPVLPEGNHRRYCFLFHFPSRYRARPLAGILLCEARTFLPVCLTRYAATVCPTCMRCGL